MIKTLWQLKCHSTFGCPRVTQGWAVLWCCSRQLCFCESLPFHLPVPEPAHPFAHPLVDLQLAAVLSPLPPPLSRNSAVTLLLLNTVGCFFTAFISPTMIVPQVPYGVCLFKKKFFYYFLPVCWLWNRCGNTVSTLGLASVIRRMWACEQQGDTGLALKLDRGKVEREDFHLPAISSRRLRRTWIFLFFYLPVGKKKKKEDLWCQKSVFDLISGQIVQIEDLDVCFSFLLYICSPF